VLALVALALVAVPAAAARGDDEPRVVEGPWIVGVEGDLTVIVDEQGNFVMTGEAAERVLRCEVTPSCRALWDDGIDAAVIVSPTGGDAAIDAAIEIEESSQAP
jgi:hypothetical protein